MIKILKIYLIALLFATNAIAGSDGEIELSKSKKDKTTKDCFEPINRATFALNQGLDKVIFKPVAKGYRALPGPIKKGTGNALNNLSNFLKMDDYQVTIDESMNSLKRDMIISKNNKKIIIRTFSKLLEDNHNNDNDYFDKDTETMAVSDYDLINNLPQIHSNIKDKI